MPVEPLRFDYYEVPLRADGSLWELGHGAMGITYKAFDTRLRVDVVLKIIKQELLHSDRARHLFLREARAAAKVRHPNIAAVITLHDSEPFYYTMEFVAGRSLAELLRGRGALRAAEALDYADQIAAALGAMAREHIVHRDLKPSNIMVVPDDERRFGQLIKVIDFGLAKGFTSDGHEPESHLRSLTNWHSGFSGTVAYASPEQCAELAEIDGRSDLYSLGVILWQMLAGHLPFSGTHSQMSAMHQQKEPPWEKLADAPEPVVALLRKLLAKERDERFAGARELRDAITAAFMQLGPEGDRRTHVAAAAGRVEAANVPTEPISRPPETVRLGTTLAERYTVGELVAEGDGGKLFKAADNRSGGSLVAMKLLDPHRAADDAFCARLLDELDRIISEPHPVFVAPSSSLLRSGHSTFYVREWVEGFSLDELLRARGGPLTAPEVWHLLDALPAAIDRATDEGLTLAEPLLRKLFICPPPDATLPPDFPSLRSQPILSWPLFQLRWNTVSFRPAEDQTAAAVTRMPDVGVSATEDPVRALALLVRELLGGRVGTLTPLPALGDQANAVVQRALAAGGGTRAYGSAGAFWGAIPRGSAPGPRPQTDGPDSADHPDQPDAAVQQRITFPVTTASATRELPPFSRGIGGIRQSGRAILIGSGILVCASIAVVFWLRQRDRVEPKSPAPASLRETESRWAMEREAASKPSPSIAPTSTPTRAPSIKEAENRSAKEREAGAKPPLSVAPTPVPTRESSAILSSSRSQPFVNSLGMKFVPVVGVSGLISIWKTRVADFQAYCDGEPYKQRGGIQTRRVDKDKNGGYGFSWRLDANASWKEPGFPQSSSHPVVGVNWYEAKNFCAWLTAKERASGKIGMNQSYRLPTDAEWSAAVGTTKYPWGNDWPPPYGAGNYLDSAGVRELTGSGWSPVPGNDGFAYTSPVGSFNANAFGLYDLGGNAWEWCEDESAKDRADRVLRGASWNDSGAYILLSTSREFGNAMRRRDDYGFRVVLDSGDR